MEGSFLYGVLGPRSGCCPLTIMLSHLFLVCLRPKDSNCVCTHTHRLSHIHTHHIHMHIHTHMHTLAHTLTHTHTLMCSHSRHMCAHSYTHSHTHTCICTHSLSIIVLLIQPCPLQGREAELGGYGPRVEEALIPSSPTEILGSLAQLKATPSTSEV